LAVYGANGAGKSSFVDALEYALNNGRIGHLAHEYSGKHQERAIINTHRPINSTSEISIVFTDNTSVRITIAPGGTHTVSGDGLPHLASWDCRRTVLRQDEVSQFVHSTKGEKYSVLLPLLGLGHLETAAENFRHLGAAVVKQSRIKEVNAALKGAQIQFQSIYDNDIPKTAMAGLTQLCDAFVAEKHSHTANECLDRVETAIDARLEDATGLQRRQVAIEQLASSDIRSRITDARAAAATLAASADEGVQRQLDVLKSAAAFLESDPAKAVNQCPACGAAISHEQMKAHLETEMTRLEDAIKKSKHYNDCVNLVVRATDRAIALCKSDEIKKWSVSLGDSRLPEIIEAAGSLTVQRDGLNELQLETIGKVVGAAAVAAASAAAFLPAPAKDLARAKERLLATRSLLRAEEAADKAKKGETLATRITQLESAIRQEIYDQTQAIIADISSDIQRMWRILHPGDLIEDVQLHIPHDTDKAIDISLKFYGKALESPRLTLSEGYRNSLGLCVFLAMAARDAGSDPPIVLDDVIVSLDRGHRGMVVNLLQKEFGGRQVLLFTHDRDWYADLRQQLGETHWAFRALVPYQSPNEGIRWSHRVGTFDDARAFVATRPDVAANEARKVMDIELAIHSEKLGIRLLFTRGEKNDKRMAHEFLAGLIAEGKSGFKKKDPASGNYLAYDDAVKAFDTADRLLLSWANRGSHSEDVATAEAEKLIETCEQAILSLKCLTCARFVHFAEVSGDGSHQCQCGLLKWK
jgi:energy-coupling factor transporter ATP-binding protein EcfA2